MYILSIQVSQRGASVCLCKDNCQNCPYWTFGSLTERWKRKKCRNLINSIKLFLNFFFCLNKNIMLLAGWLLKWWHVNKIFVHTKFFRKNRKKPTDEKTSMVEQQKRKSYLIPLTLRQDNNGGIKITQFLAAEVLSLIDCWYDNVS